MFARLSCLLWIPLLAGLLVNCTSETKTTSPIVAQVNDRFLTLEDAEQELRQFAPSEVTLADVVARWVNTELLYQAALDHDLHKDSTLRKAVEDYRRNLLGNKYLDTEIKGAISIPYREIRHYYEEHKSSFVRLTDEAKVYHFVVSDRTAADQIARTLRRKRSGGERQELFSTYPVEAATVKKGFLMPELDQAIFSSSGVPRVVGPLEIDGRFHVVEILKHYRKDSAIGLDEAYDEIYQRLLQRRRMLLSKHILDSLRTQAVVKINLEALP
jgi:hypothetical protein